MAPGLRHLVTELSRLTGVAEVEVHFLVFQGLCLILAFIYRSFLHPSKVSTTTRHAVAVLLGLYVGIYHYSWSICHILIQASVAYILMYTIDPKKHMPQVVFVFTMGYLCIEQLRKALSSDLTSIDHSTSMMIITQKITSLAFCIKDGQTDMSKLNPRQRELAVRRFPTPLEYCSYVFHFQAFLVGPFCFYKEYMDFVEGKDLLMNATGHDDKPQFTKSKQPSALRAILGKLVCASGIIIIIAVVSPHYPIEGNTWEEVTNSSYIYRVFYMWWSLTLCQMKYVIAWLLVDAICNASGLGFNGYHSDGRPKWDRMTNVHFLTFLMGTNLKDFTDNWNISTAKWLKSVCYERVPVFKEMSTFLLSAVWHGFYFGYYFCAVSLTLMVLSSRKLRRNVRPYFLQNTRRKTFYDWLTWIASTLSAVYFSVSFPLVTFQYNIKFYSSTYFCGHIIAILIIAILPRNKTDKKTVARINDNVTKYEKRCDENVPEQTGNDSISTKKNL